jgi:hypothetical protein
MLVSRVAKTLALGLELTGAHIAATSQAVVDETFDAGRQLRASVVNLVEKYTGARDAWAGTIVARHSVRHDECNERNVADYQLNASTRA